MWSSILWAIKMSSCITGWRLPKGLHPTLVCVCQVPMTHQWHKKWPTFDEIELISKGTKHKHEHYILYTESEVWNCHVCLVAGQECCWMFLHQMIFAKTSMNHLFIDLSSSMTSWYKIVWILRLLLNFLWTNVWLLCVAAVLCKDVNYRTEITLAAAWTSYLLCRCICYSSGVNQRFAFYRLCSRRS